MPTGETDRRRPRGVYGVGTEPDPRFTLANERTFLAGIRTSLALVAAGVALGVLETGLGSAWLHQAAAVVLVGLGVLFSGSTYRRWARAERALRTGAPLPAVGLAAVLGYGLAVVGLVVLALVVAGA